MTVFLAVIAGIFLTFIPQFIQIFSANVELNSIIILVFITAVVRSYQNVLILIPEMDWLKNFLSTRKLGINFAPKLLNPLAEILRGHQGKSTPYLSSGSLQSILDITGSRLQDYKDTARYFVNVLIFLGLLGTFFGLLMTIGSIANVVNNLAFNTTDFELVFQSLKEDLATPLSGMGVAFSSSLLGLSASLILGFLTLQVNQAQNDFYNLIEEKLSSLTRISGGIKGAKGEDSIFSYLQALLEQTGDTLNRLETAVLRSEENSQQTNATMESMAKSLINVSTSMKNDLSGIESIAKSYQSLTPMIDKLNQLSENLGMDTPTKNNIKSIDTNIKTMTTQLSNDLKVLAKTIAIEKTKPAKKNKTEE